MDVFIYILIDPRTNEPRYVGKTINLDQRLVDHCKEQGSTHKNHWLGILKRDGIKPIMEVIETIENSNDLDWQERERHWINHFFSIGAPLTNLDSGGIEGKCHSEETKRKMSNARIGVRLSDESIEKMKATKLANLTPETRHRIGNGMRGKKHSAEARAKMSASGKGRPKSAEHRAKISAANKGAKPAAHALAAAATVNKKLAENRRNILQANR